MLAINKVILQTIVLIKINNNNKKDKREWTFNKKKNKKFVKNVEFKEDIQKVLLVHKFIKKK